MKSEIEILRAAQVFVNQGIQLQVDGVVHIIELVINTAQGTQNLCRFFRLAMIQPERVCRYGFTERQDAQRRLPKGNVRFS